MFMKRAALALIAVLLSGRLLLGPIRQGWSEMKTDFPNHYVAAVLTLRHEPLRLFYEWEWFERQIHYAGIDQLGTYIPYTPLTMTPLLPLAKLPPQRAKQVWIVLEVLFLAASVALLKNLSGLGALEVFVLALLAYASLATNLLLGHYYVFLLFLLAGAVWCLLRGREFSGGALLGLIFALKLYAAPFLLFFAVRRQWRALSGMVGAIAASTIAAVAMFGGSAVWFFATNVMVRAGNGDVTNPYDPLLGSMTVLLKRLFLPEAELNPHPLFNAPGLGFFLQAFYALGLLALVLVALPRTKDSDGRAIAWFIVALFALSPIQAYSHFILLLVPVALLLRGASFRWGAGLIVLYVLVELPVRPWAAWMFPRLWFTLALLVYVGWSFLSTIRARTAVLAIGAAAVVSAGVAANRMRSYRLEPPQANERVVTRAGALFASAPAVGPGQIIYESMEEAHFRLRSTAGDFFQPDGDAFHPTTAANLHVYFELVSNGRSEIVGGPKDAIDPAISLDDTKLAFVAGRSLGVLEGGKRSRIVEGDVSGPSFFPDGQRIAFAEGFPGSRSIRVADLSGGASQTLTGGDCFQPSVSPDGKQIAFACSEIGATQVWVMNLETRERRRVTGGACNNQTPAWDVDSRSVVFSSDCERGFGLSALFHVRVAP
jgi:Glycosyltransferase family 87/WD40-like Beta Propeller Repeat